MNNTWLQYPTTSNNFNQSYIKDFLDVSGNIYVRNGSLNGYVSDISVNGIIYFNSISATNTVIASDLQTALNTKQNLLTSNFGLSVTGNTIIGNVVSISANVITQTAAVAGSAILGNTWTQSIPITNSNLNQFGRTVAMSGDGNTILVGQNLYDRSGFSGTDNAGAIYTYKFTTSWSLVGSEILGIAANEQMPTEMACNYDGTIMVFASSNRNTNGVVQVYKWVSNNWTTLGQSTWPVFTASVIANPFGVAISSDGTRIAHGTNFSSSGNPQKVRIYHFNNSTLAWTLITTLSAVVQPAGVSLGAAFGFTGCLSFSDDGNTLAIGAQCGTYTTSTATNATCYGLVYIYKYVSSWSLFGGQTNLVGPGFNDRFGQMLKISGDGLSVAVSGRGDLNGTDCGYVKVYTYNGSNWVQKGSTLDAPATDYFMLIKGIDYTGTHIITFAQTRSTTAYFFQVYKYVGSNWVQYSPKYSGPNSAIWGNWANQIGYNRDLSKIAVGSDTNGQVYLFTGALTTAGGTAAYTGVNGNLIVTGDLTITGNEVVSGAVVHTSDGRIKFNRCAISNALSTIVKLEPEIYDKKDTLDDLSYNVIARESGLIAQNIWYKTPELRHLVVLPENVNQEDISMNMDIDMDINVDPDYASMGWSNKPAYVNYEGFVAILIKAIQELKAKAQSQREEIQTIKISKSGKNQI
jgi:hypothetical protein